MLKTVQPKVDESTLMYRNPLGVKGGKNKIALGIGMAVIAVMLVFVGVYFMRNANVPLGVVLTAVACVYVGLCGYNVYTGIKLIQRPFAVIIDAQNLILREKDGYLHLPLKEMRRLTIDCEGIDAYLNVNPDGNYDVLIKGDNMFYTTGGVQSALTSRNMRKIAFILNSIALNAESDVNWGSRFDELLYSDHVQTAGISEGLNKALDDSAKAANLAAKAPLSGNESAKASGDEDKPV